MLSLTPAARRNKDWGFTQPLAEKYALQSSHSWLAVTHHCVGSEALLRGRQPQRPHPPQVSGRDGEAEVDLLLLVGGGGTCKVERIGSNLETQDC